MQATWLTVFLGLDPIPYRLAFTGTPRVECPETSPSSLGTLLRAERGILSNGFRVCG